MPSCQRMKIGTGFTMHHHHRHFVLAVRSSIGLVRFLVVSLVLSPYSFSVFLGPRSYVFTHMLHFIGYLNLFRSCISSAIQARCKERLCTLSRLRQSSAPCGNLFAATFSAMGKDTKDNKKGKADDTRKEPWWSRSQNGTDSGAARFKGKKRTKRSKSTSSSSSSTSSSKGKKREKKTGKAQKYFRRHDDASPRSPPRP